MDWNIFQIVQWPSQDFKGDLTLITYGFLFYFMLIRVYEDQKKPHLLFLRVGKFLYDALKTPTQTRRQKSFQKWNYRPPIALFGII